MNVVNEARESDGSAWTAVVEVRGVFYRASYVASKLDVGLAPYKHAPRRPRWALDYVKQWAAKQVAALPADWIDLHKAMYA